MPSGLEISMAGNFIDPFQGSLPVSYISHEISLPGINANSNHEAHYDFVVPSDIAVPMLYLAYESGDGNGNSLYYFTHLGGNSWRLTMWGVGYVQPVIGWRKNWTEPLLKPGTKLIIGGFRG